MALRDVGLSGPFSQRRAADCPRCKLRVEASFPWPHWQRLRRAWFCVLAGILSVSPLFMSDSYVLLPSAMVFVSAIGPLNGLARIRATCLRCGCVVDEPGRPRVVS
jgi:hypothetical protein